MSSIPKGFGGFLQGSNKALLARVWVTEGREAALAKAEELGMKKSSIKIWMSTFKKLKLDKQRVPAE